MKRPILFYFVLTLLFTGCQILGSANPKSSDIADEVRGSGVNIQKIYIQSFTGQNVEEVQAVFFNTVSEQNLLTFVELLPDDYIGLKILRLEVTDYSVWEADETLGLAAKNSSSSKILPDKVLRRNAIVGFKVSLYEAESGMLLLRKPYSQPFQQIYVGSEEIKKIPQKDVELKRLTRVLVHKLLTDFYQVNSEPLEMELEKGYGYDWISLHIYNLGESRIKKGIRFAQAGDFDRAIWMWQLVLYEAGDNIPLDVYQKNRASAYFNLGVVYHKLGDWLKAAEMYSMANRMEQKLKYAQVWGNTMQTWIEAQKSAEDQVNELAVKKQDVQGILKPAESKPAVTDVEPISDAEILRRLEQNEQLLLKARELWPLEPALKYAETPAVEPTPVTVPEKTNDSEEMMNEVNPENTEPSLIQPMDSDEMDLQDNLIRQVPDGATE